MEAFNHDLFFAKMKFFKLFGNTIRIYDQSESKQLLFVKQKAFKLKEEITVYADESEKIKLLSIKARSVLDFGATYDVFEFASNTKIGSLRRKGLASTFGSDSWIVLDSNENQIASITEDSLLLALIRKYILNIIPQSFVIKANEQDIGIFKQTWNPFLPQMRVDFSSDKQKILDRRLGISAMILLQCIEGKQN